VIAMTSADYGPDTLPSIVHELIHLILIKYSEVHTVILTCFADQQAEGQRSILLKVTRAGNW
jgi:hypothetical protein